MGYTGLLTPLADGASPMTIDYVLDGTATQGVDYALEGSGFAGATVQPGERMKRCRGQLSTYWHLRQWHHRRPPPPTTDRETQTGQPRVSCGGLARASIICRLLPLSRLATRTQGTLRAEPPGQLRRIQVRYYAFSSFPDCAP
jgi:hypothetical protein